MSFQQFADNSLEGLKKQRNELRHSLLNLYQIREFCEAKSEDLGEYIPKPLSNFVIGNGAYGDISNNKIHLSKWV
ncbi:hypothetical protein [Photobacterium rosenbergii]|uniref:hypothetical protein n=1 Tax=Photobacterium rosenbergii TaxID=294936 RepID=UPI001C99665C|nr:hypothetical protein [Photobacterium rosenbergii]MBY5949306.1 hypothetical protein [Photobacterium rosenbergii]